MKTPANTFAINDELYAIIDKWGKSKGHYSFEIRFHPPLGPDILSPNTQNVRIAFIIDVMGFYSDNEFKHPIKLHHVEDLSIDPFDTSEEYREYVSRQLSDITERAYAGFSYTLQSYGESVVSLSL